MNIRGAAEAVLLRRRYTVVKDAARAGDARCLPPRSAAH